MKVRFPRRGAALLCFVFACTALVAVTSGSAGAAGPVGPLYRVSLAENCNVVAICPLPGMGMETAGSFTGSVQFYANGTAKADFTFSGHLQFLPDRGNADAGHIQEYIDGTAASPGWYIGPDGNFFKTNETTTIMGRIEAGGTGGPPFTFTIPFENTDTHIPATPGHYSTAEILGVQPPPGINWMINVTKVGG